MATAPGDADGAGGTGVGMATRREPDQTQRGQADDEKGVIG